MTTPTFFKLYPYYTNMTSRGAGFQKSVIPTRKHAPLKNGGGIHLEHP